MTAKETTELRRKLAQLDKLRTKLGELDEQEKDLASECISLMDAHKQTRFNFGENRQAVLTTPATTKIDPDAFRRIAVEANLTDEQIDACVNTTISVGAARKALGDERVDAIAKTRPGKPQLRITGER